MQLLPRRICGKLCCRKMPNCFRQSLVLMWYSFVSAGQVAAFTALRLVERRLHPSCSTFTKIWRSSSARLLKIYRALPPINVRSPSSAEVMKLTNLFPVSILRPCLRRHKRYIFLVLCAWSLMLWAWTLVLSFGKERCNN